MTLRRLILLGLTSCLARPAAAQAADEDLSVVEVGRGWQAIAALFESHDGQLWIGTRTGLVRHDGVSFRTFTRADVPAWPGHDVRALAGAPDGTIWVALAERPGLARIVGGTPQAVALKGTPLADINALAVAPDGAVWLGTDAGLGRVAGKPLTFTLIDGASPVSALALDRQGRLVTAGPAGISVRDGVRGTEQNRVGIDDDVTALLAPTRDVVLVGTRTGRVLRLTTGASAAVRTVLGREAGVGIVNTLSAGGGGGVLVGGSKGLWRLHGQQVSRLPVRDEVSATLHDHAGNVWAGGRPALRRLTRPLVRSYGDPGERPQLAFSLAEALDGSIWFSTVRAIMQVTPTGKLVHHATGTTTGLPFCLRGLAAARDGGVYIAACEELFVRFDGTKVVGHGLALPRPPPPGHVRVLSETDDGTLWLAGDRGGVWRMRAGRLAPLAMPDLECPDTSKDKPCPGRVLAMATGADGSRWFGTASAGLYHWPGDDARAPGSRHFTTAHGLPSNEIQALLPDGPNTLWIGTADRGLVRMRGDTFATIDTAHGLPSAHIHALVDDRQGRLWIGSADGVFRVDKPALEAAADGGGRTVEAVRYGTRDGMASERVSNNVQPEALRARDGRVWFATHDGVTVFDLPAMAALPALPAVLIRRVLADGRSLTADRGGRFTVRGPLSRLHIEYVAPNVSMPHRVSYRYRLVGNDRDFIDAGGDRQARYTNLPAGQYTFTVAAMLDDHERSRVETSVQLEVTRLRDSPLVVVGAFALVLVGAFAVHRVRVAGAHRRFALILDERNRIARDLHDGLAQGFAAIGFELDRLGTRLERDPQKAQAQLEKVHDLVRQCRLTARQTVWNLRTRDLTHVSLPEAIRQTASQASLAGNVAITVEVEGKPLAVSDALTDALVAIVQEAITNAIVHGQASRIAVALSFVAEAGRPWLRLCIRDDGHGFDPAGRPADGGAHLGLVGMRERAQGLGGRLIVHSAPAAPTVITVDVPVQRGKTAPAAAAGMGNEAGLGDTEKR